VGLLVSDLEFLGLFEAQTNIQVYFGRRFNMELLQRQVFRDPSAWYHIVVAVDTTQATPANRTKVYVNGVELLAQEQQLHKMPMIQK
jgi:hypothetical protein